jgi:phosphopantothenoylcysteine decarboxylase / phosphopantothenate---cysteine ligase
VENAQAKLAAKNCDMVVANFLGNGSRVLGGEMNKVIVLTREGQEAWPSMTKEEVARRLVAQLARMLAANSR